MRILIVDDNLMIQDALALVLKDGGHDPVFAVDGASSRAFDETEFDAVVLDYDLPDIKGDVLAREIRAARPGAAIILASGRLPQSVDLSAVDLFLEKPFTPSSLLAGVLKAQASRRAA